MSNSISQSGQDNFSSFWAHYYAADQWRKRHRDMVQESYMVLQPLSSTSVISEKEANSLKS